jgi:hypothetical protein
VVKQGIKSGNEPNSAAALASRRHHQGYTLYGTSVEATGTATQTHTQPRYG